MLPFSPYPILLITFNTMLDASSERIFFFLLITARRIFIFGQVSLTGFFFGGGEGEGIFTPPPVISNSPSLSTEKISFS